MRRFSQRNHLVTLNDINITPLLDLAFVLLIIFVITTPLLEQSLKLNLPSAERVDMQPPPPKESIRTVEVSPTGAYVMEGTPVTIEQVRVALAQAFATNPNLGVVIRIDRDDKVGKATAVLDLCEAIGIRKVGFATKPVQR